MDRVVLDTNCLLSSLKRDSVYYPIWNGFMSGQFCLCFSDEILDEYEEIMALKTGSADIARNVISAILNRSNILHVEVFFRFGLITADNDDNKFVDCAIKAGAHYIVSNDKHYNVLKEIPFPHIEVNNIYWFLTKLTSH